MGQDQQQGIAEQLLDGAIKAGVEHTHHRVDQTAEAQTDNGKNSGRFQIDAAENKDHHEIVKQHSKNGQEDQPNDGNTLKAVFEAPEKGSGQRRIVFLVLHDPHGVVKAGLGSADGKERQAADQKQNVQNDQIRHIHQRLHKGIVVAKQTFHGFLRIM